MVSDPENLLFSLERKTEMTCDTAPAGAWWELPTEPLSF